MNNITTARHRVLGAMLLSVILWSACQKTPLPPNVMEPTVFSVSPLDSISALTAGLNEVYLYTDFGRDSNEVLVFSGTFARVDCQPVEVCPGSVRFEFRNVNEGSNVSPEEAFHEGEFEYTEQSSGQVDTVYRITFTAKDTAGFQEFNWMFNGADTASGNIVVRDFKDMKPVQVSLATGASNQVQSTLLRRMISVSGTETFASVQIRIRPDTSSMVENLIEAVTPLVPSIAAYEWSPDSLQKVPGYFTQDISDRYAITVTAEGNSTASAQAIGTSQLDRVFITPSFEYSMQPITVGDQFQLGRVAIQWVDPQGIVWRSDWGKQAQVAQFIVTSTEPYEPNEKGQSTRKMSVVFRCILYSKNGEVQNFEGTGVIAVAY